VRPKARVLALISVMPKTNIGAGYRQLELPDARSRAAPARSGCMGCPSLPPTWRSLAPRARLRPPTWRSLTPTAAHIALDIGTAAAGPLRFSVPVLPQSIHDHHPDSLALECSSILRSCLVHTPLTWWSKADIGFTCSNLTSPLPPPGHCSFRFRFRLGQSMTGIANSLALILLLWSPVLPRSHTPHLVYSGHGVCVLRCSDFVFFLQFSRC
jgi:hypothetical protein